MQSYDKEQDNYTLSSVITANDVNKCGGIPQQQLTTPFLACISFPMIIALHIQHVYPLTDRNHMCIFNATQYVEITDWKIYQLYHQHFFWFPFSFLYASPSRQVM